jgi:Bacterial CdiA-CT RNAse A domain
MSICQRLGVVVSIAIGLLCILSSCKPTQPWAQAGQQFTNQPHTAQAHTAPHDLSLDESHGGHTLKRHVGRTDNDLEARLRQEPGISAASTYTDRATAELVIAGALNQNREKIERWLERDKHPNLVVDYDGERPVGRTMNRGSLQSQPCAHAIIVLRWDGPNEYHVLTSYPECH